MIGAYRESNNGDILSELILNDGGEVEEIDYVKSPSGRVAQYRFTSTNTPLGFTSWCGGLVASKNMCVVTPRG